jgi:hypothetical protein
MIMPSETETRALRKEISRLRGLLARNGIIVVDEPNIYPSQRQFDELLQIVLRSYPLLRPTEGSETSFGDEFRRAFLRLSYARRVERYDARDIVDLKREAERWLVDQGFESELTLNAYECAIVAHDDFRHSEPPHDAERFRMRVGAEFNGLSGRGYTGAWKALLDRGAVKPPAKIEHDRNVA